MSSFQAPPNSESAEKSLLGGVFLDSSMLDDVVGIVSSDDFYFPRNRILWEAMVSLGEKRSAIDSETIVYELQRQQTDTQISMEYLIEVLESVPHTQHTVYYARQVLSKSMARQVIVTCQKAIDDAQSDLEAPVEQISSIVNQLEEVAAVSAGDLMSAKEQVERYYEWKKRPIEPVTTGLRDLDKKLKGGMHGGRLFVVGADSGMGKSSFCNQLVMASARSGAPALQFHLEMRDHELSQRIESQGDHALKDYAVLPVYTEQTTYDLQGIIATIRRAKRQLGIQMVVIDYIQLVEGGRNKSESVERAVPALKRTAEDLRIPIILLAQLNRKLHERDDKRPKKSDLANASELEKGADAILFLHRPEVYGEQDKAGICEIIIVKHRGGATGIVKTCFDQDRTMFSDYDYRDASSVVFESDGVAAADVPF